MKKDYVTKEYCNLLNGKIREDIADIKESLFEIKNNHLAHLNDKVIELSTKMSLLGKVSSLVLGGLITLIVSFILLIIGGK